MSGDIVHGPNFVHPETASAVGSRNSITREGRDEYNEGRLVVDEEVDKIVNHIHSKLPPEISTRLEVMGSVKSKLHNYFNQSNQNMLNRYLTTVEDEMGKKLRDMIDTEEMRGLNRYTSRPISFLLDRVGGSDKFNTGEIEKSIVNMFGHLHGHVQREMNDLETGTNSLLRRKTDVGAFVRGENAYSIIKCSFRDHPEKPDTVMQVKLALNVSLNEMISPIFPYQESTAFIVKDLIAKKVYESVDAEIDRLNESMVDEGKAELTSEEKIFERIKALDNFVSDDETESSKRYNLLAKKFFDAIEGLNAEIDSSEFDALGIRENIHRVVEDENIRNRGFNTAVNTLTHVLDWSRMGYQHIENFKGARKLTIREYVETDENVLPDERFQVDLIAHGPVEIQNLRDAYYLQLQELERTIQEVWDVTEIMYNEYRDQVGDDDWASFSERVLDKKQVTASWFTNLFSGGEEEDEEIQADSEEVKHWNEMNFITAEETPATSTNPTFENRLLGGKVKFPVMYDRLKYVFGESSPDLRETVENRLRFLEAEFTRFGSLINPFHMQPGVILDLDIVSIKRKSTTMMNMANVLNEFLYGISKGFQDSAFAAFSRRRSTEREDISGEFAAAGGMDEMTEAEEVFD